MNSKIKQVICLVVALMMVTTGSFADGYKYNKEETVYAITDSVGKVENKIVSIWVHSNKGKIDVNNKTLLQDVKNIKGEEDIVIEDSKINYKSEESDIYYRGTTDEKLPFSINVSYYIDGKELKPDEVIGKSGKLKMVMSFKNRVSKTINLEEKERDIYMPMLVAGTVNLPVDKFRNVKVNNGQIINDAKNQILTFVSAPGMKESFNFESEELNEKWDTISSDIVIEAGVEDFELDSPMIMVNTTVPELENIYDIDEAMEGLEELKDKAGDLLLATEELKNGQSLFNDKLIEYTNAVDMLTDGAGQLSEASKQIMDKTGELVAGSDKLTLASSEFINGISAFVAGSSDFLTGANKLFAGSEEFIVGLNAYAEGAMALVEGTKGLAEGAKKLEGGLSELNEGMKLSNEGLVTLVNGIAESKEASRVALESQIAAYDAMILDIDASILELGTMLQQDPENQVLSAMVEKMYIQKAMLEGMAEGSRAGIEELSNPEQAEGIQKLLESYSTIQANLEQVALGCGDMSEGGAKLEEGVSLMDEKTQTLTEGLAKLNAGQTALSDGVTKLNVGSETIKNKTTVYIDSMNLFNTGINDFYSQGTQAFYDSMSLYSGKINELSQNNSKLLDGEQSLLNGNTTLNEELRASLSEVDSEEIDKILNDLSTLSKVGDELLQLSEENRYFVEDLDDSDQSVKYIVKIKSLKK